MSDNEIARMARDIEAYRGAGERYEQEIARKDDAIAGQARQLREALAALEQVKRERNAAVRDLSTLSYCGTCSNPKDNTYCIINSNMQGKRTRPCPEYIWNSPCAENGGTEDGI